MPVDQYEQDFQYMVAKDLPNYMESLIASMRNPIPMSDFGIEGLGVVGLCRQLGLDADFPGCYVLVEDSTPKYVGISKKVLHRLRQHVRGTTHFSASLAYRIASQNLPHKYTRANAMKQTKFKAAFEEAKEYLRGMNVGYVEIPNPLVLYVFEPYCAMKLDTGEMNTFETH